MKRIKYELLIMWSGFWLKVWGAWQFFGFPENLDNRLFSWIVAQCGYGYMGDWEMAKHLDF